MGEGIITRKAFSGKVKELVSASGVIDFYSGTIETDRTFIKSDLTFKPIMVGIYYKISAGYDFGAAFWDYRGEYTLIKHNNNDSAGMYKVDNWADQTSGESSSIDYYNSIPIELLDNGFIVTGFVYGGDIGGGYGGENPLGEWFAIGYEV